MAWANRDEPLASRFFEGGTGALWCRSQRPYSFLIRNDTLYASGYGRTGESHVPSQLWTDPKFQRIADLVPAIIFVVGPGGSVTFTNARWQEYTGQTSAEAMGDGWAAYVHPEDAANMIAVREVTRGDQQEAEFRCLGADGRYRWFLMRSEPLFDEEGRLVGRIGASVEKYGHPAEE
jgi:PAS domain S-box-containing protein